MDLKNRDLDCCLHLQKAGKKILSSKNDIEPYYVDFNKAPRAGVTLRRRENEILSVLLLFLHFWG